MLVKDDSLILFAAYIWLHELMYNNKYALKAASLNITVPVLFETRTAKQIVLPLSVKVYNTRLDPYLTEGSFNKCFISQSTNSKPNFNECFTSQSTNFRPSFNECFTSQSTNSRQSFNKRFTSQPLPILDKASTNASQTSLPILGQVSMNASWASRYWF